MNLYLIWQKVNKEYDSFDSAVVAAADAESARRMSPSDDYDAHASGAWAAPHQVFVRPIGTADVSITSPQVICASFNAG